MLITQHIISKRGVKSSKTQAHEDKSSSAVSTSKTEHSKTERSESEPSETESVPSETDTSKNGPDKLKPLDKEISAAKSPEIDSKTSETNPSKGKASETEESPPDTSESKSLKSSDSDPSKREPLKRDSSKTQTSESEPSSRKPPEHNPSDSSPSTSEFLYHTPTQMKNPDHELPVSNSPTTGPILLLKLSINTPAQLPLPLQFSPVIKTVAMVFDDCKSLGTESIKKWINVTNTFITSEIMNQAAEREIFFLEANIFFYKQFVPVEQGETIGNKSSTTYPNATRHQRYLQSSPLALFFDLQFTFQSSLANQPFEGYFIGTLDTKEKQGNYINQLQTCGDSVFNSINGIKVLLDGLDISQLSQMKTVMDKKHISVIWLVADIIIGVLTATAVTVLFIAVRSRKEMKNELHLTEKDMKKNVEDQGEKQHPQEGDKVNDEISVYIDVPGISDDVSTLGTPIETWRYQSEKFDDPTIGER